MKAIKLLAISLFLVVLVNASAQDSTLVNEGMVVIDHSNDDFKTILGSDAKHGGYISFDLLAGQTQDNQSLMEIGGRLGWIMNHGFTFGFAGYGLVGNVKNDITYVPNYASSTDFASTKELNLGGGYGGLFIEPILFPKKTVHVSFPILFGVGGVGFYEPFNPNHDWDYDEEEYDVDVITVIRPGVDVEFNVTRFFRVGLSANYRFVNNLELTTNQVTDAMLPSDYLNGFNYGFSLKFGWF